MSIYVEKRNGRVTGNFVVEVQDEGERFKVRVKTMAEAKKIEKDIRRGRWKPPEPQRAPTYVTLGALIKNARLNRPRKKKSWWTDREIEYCEELLGSDRDVETITSQVLMQLAKDVKAKRNCSNATANRYVYALMGLLRWGREQDLVVRSAVFNRLDEGDNQRTQWLTPEQEAKVCDWLVANGRPIIALCIEILGRTGMRSGELCSLTAEQIDPDSQTITLWDQKDGSIEEGLPINQELAESLRTLAETQALPSQTILLKWFKRAAKACGLPVGRGKNGVVVHSLRHSTATRLVRAGVHAAEIQGYMRHKSWATTQRYIKITGEQKRQAFEILGNAGEKVRGISGEKTANIAKVANDALKIHEENQPDGSLSRTRTCDHSINSLYQTDLTKTE